MRKSVAVYGSTWDSIQDAERYAGVARVLGEVISSRGIELIFGGGKTGMMGAVCDAVLAGGGKATGVVIRGAFRPTDDHDGCQRILVEDFHSRIRKYWALSEGFLALPGAVGTLHEVLDPAAISRCGLSRDPVGLVNIGGYWDPIHEMVSRMGEHCFMSDTYNRMRLDFLSTPCRIDPDNVDQFVEDDRDETWREVFTDWFDFEGFVGISPDSPHYEGGEK